MTINIWISVLYRKYDNFGKDHSNFDIDYLEQRDMFDQYSKHIRPEMLKLLTFLKGHITTTNKQTGFQTPLPIRIEAGAERIEIDNTAGWFVGALEEYLHTFLGVENKEEAEEELKTVYSSKGRKLDAAFALMMMGTYHLLTTHSNIKPKSNIIRLTLDFLELLDLASENDDENNLNAKIACLEKRNYTPKWDMKPQDIYRTSPNNHTNETINFRLW